MAYLTEPFSLFIFKLFLLIDLIISNYSYIFYIYYLRSQATNILPFLIVVVDSLVVILRVLHLFALISSTFHAPSFRVVFLFWFSYQVKYCPCIHRPNISPLKEAHNKDSLCISFAFCFLPCGFSFIFTFHSISFHALVGSQFISFRGYRISLFFFF